MITNKFTFFVATATLTLSMNALSQTDLNSALVEWSSTPTNREEPSKLVVIPAIGSETTREIGDALVRTGIRTMHVETFWNATLKEAATGTLGFFAGFRRVSALAGATGRLLFHQQSKSPMVCINTRGEGMSKLDIPEMTGCYADTDRDGKFDSILFPGHDIDGKLEKPIEYEMGPKQVKEFEKETSRSYFVEVIYQGVSKGEAKVSYREFKGGIARPAFTQDVSYELDPDGSGVIAFRGLRIKIVKATRENITYIVQQIGSAPL